MATTIVSTAGAVGQQEPEPGPSSFQSFAVRRWITISYWTILILCVPYWWTSTTIERHALPLDEIATWQNRGVSWRMQSRCARLTARSTYRSPVTTRGVAFLVMNVARVLQPCPVQLPLHLDFTGSISPFPVAEVLRELNALNTQSQQCLAFEANGMCISHEILKT